MTEKRGKTGPAVRITRRLAATPHDVFDAWTEGTGCRNIPADRV